MGTFSVPVTIGVNEDEIAKEVEKDVKREVIKNITEKVENIIYDPYRRYHRGSDDTPLRNMVREEISNVLKNKEDVIVETAAKALADKLFKSKAVREMAAKIVAENMEE